MFLIPQSRLTKLTLKLTLPKLSSLGTAATFVNLLKIRRGFQKLRKLGLVRRGAPAATGASGEGLGATVSVELYEEALTLELGELGAVNEVTCKLN